MRRPRPIAVSAVLAVMAGLIFGASPASAAVSNASISPSVWQPGEQAQAVVTFDSSTASTGTSGDDFSVEIGWGWVYQYANPSQTPAQYAATHSGTTYTCATIGVTFQSPGFASAPGTPGSVECEVLASSSYVGNPGQQVRLMNTGANGFTFTSGNAVTVTFPAGTITAPSTGPASDTWRIIDVAGGSGVTVTTTVPAPTDSEGNPLPLVTIDIDANGGQCLTSRVTGYQGTWALAPDANSCQKPGQSFFGFNTSADGSGLAIAPGGNLHLTNDNRLYAIYAEPRVAGAPTNVVATPGRNTVKVSWTAPADAGSNAITNYLAQATPSGRVCVTRPTDADMLSCTFDLPATNTRYTFDVQALNGVGWGTKSAASDAVSPYDFGKVEASRPNVLLGLAGTKVQASGAAPGLAGKSVTAQYKVGPQQDWTTVANAATVDAAGRFSWSKKFGPSLNKQNVTLRFTYGADTMSGTYVLSRGGQAGNLSEPRNIKVENVVNKVKVTWDPPKFDGGEKIIGYTMCAKGAGSLCQNVSADGQGVFQNLATGREYTITVAARTATRTGPEATAKQKVSPVEASVRISMRTGQAIKVEAEALGFKAGAKFRLEAAVVVFGRPADTWRWEELQSFTGNGRVNKGFSEDLGAYFDGETIAVRLVTPNGSVYSRVSRP